MGWEKEFPEFPPADLPKLPDGWSDISWHNDACPCFGNLALRLVLFTDYADPKQREMGMKAPRYVLNRTNAEGVLTDDPAVFWGDDWAGVEKAIMEVAATQNGQPAQDPAFEKFRASARINLEADLERIEYADGYCHIDLVVRGEHRAEGCFALTIANMSEIGFDLARFERMLFEWATSEGILKEDGAVT